jgi:hypothetical protein
VRVKALRISAVGAGGRMPSRSSLEAAVQAMRFIRLLSELLKALRRTLVIGLIRGFGLGSASSTVASGSTAGGARSCGCVMMVSVRIWMTISLRAS